MQQRRVRHCPQRPLDELETGRAVGPGSATSSSACGTCSSRCARASRSCSACAVHALRHGDRPGAVGLTSDAADLRRLARTRSSPSTAAGRPFDLLGPVQRLQLVLFRGTLLLLATSILACSVNRAPRLWKQAMHPRPVVSPGVLRTRPDVGDDRRDRNARGGRGDHPGAARPPALSDDRDRGRRRARDLRGPLPLGAVRHGDRAPQPDLHPRRCDVRGDGLPRHELRDRRRLHDPRGQRHEPVRRGDVIHRRLLRQRFAVRLRKRPHRVRPRGPGRREDHPGQRPAPRRRRDAVPVVLRARRRRGGPRHDRQGAVRAGRARSSGHPATTRRQSASSSCRGRTSRST